MLPLYVPEPPLLLGYLHTFTWFTGLLFIAGLAILIAYPILKRKIATLWIIVGLFQIVFSGFYLYPYSIFASFPTEVTFGIITLGCGAIIFALSSFIKVEVKKTVMFWAGLTMFVCSSLFLYSIFWTYFSEPALINITLASSVPAIAIGIALVPIGLTMIKYRGQRS